MFSLLYLSLIFPDKRQVFEKLDLSSEAAIFFKPQALDKP